jgi:hypothetical protein
MTNPHPLHAALFLTAGLTLAGLAHSAWMRSGRSQPFAIALDRGRTLGGRRLFGPNKTLRGFMMMPPASAASFATLAALLGADGIARANLWPLGAAAYAALGAWAGLWFMLGELPNSFIKRQVGVAPGAAARGRGAAFLHFAADRCDSILGMLLGVSLVVPLPLGTWGWMLLIGPGIHWAFSALLHRLGVKARAA